MSSGSAIVTPCRAAVPVWGPSSSTLAAAAQASNIAVPGMSTLPPTCSRAEGNHAMWIATMWKGAAFYQGPQSKALEGSCILLRPTI